MSSLDVLKEYDNRIKKINSFIKNLKAYPSINSKFEINDEFFNKFLDKLLFISLAELDLLIGLKYLDFSHTLKNQIEANYFARVVALSTYEIIQHTSKLLGNDMKNIIVEKYGDERFDEIKIITRKISKTASTEKKLLQIIRNNLIAHKEENGLLQTELMISINNEEIYALGNKISNHQLELINKYLEIWK